MMEQKGLSFKEADKRLKKFGKNEIKREKKVNPVKIFFSQFTSPLILLLIVAAIVSWAMRFFPGQESNTIDVILILIIVFASGISGFFQDYKAEKTIEALQKIATPKTRVVRGGREMVVSITALVPGDLILLESGDIIPADAKLIEAFNLEVDESILTGESKAVSKKLSDELFKGTLVNSGSAKALITKTGMQTKMGNIAFELQGMKEEKTPFQVDIDKFSKKILFIVLGVIIVIFLISLVKYSLYESILTSISLAVAALPEGLPAVLVLVLAIGAKVMASKNALVRKLNVVESSGSVDIICTDKTGTLTKNEMAVTKLFFNNKTYEVSGKISNELNPLLICGGICNNSKIGYDEKGDKERIYLGDQTEIALKKISESLLKEDLKKYEKVGEISFTSERKMMSVISKNLNKYFLFSKGAPEVLIKKCNRIYVNGKTIKMSEPMKKEILEHNKKFASQALRVLGFAFKETLSKEASEKNLVWLGLQAMMDPPRKEVMNSIKNCRTAGIRVIMLTGDSPITAKAIADKVGLESKGVMEGKELDKISDKELEKRLEAGINVFARINPFHKLKILEILKKKHIVAMTGDGVNDALALKKADVGISMGVRGTEVAKQASDIILLDDNFSTIVVSVKEGRRAFNNIRKFINYLFVCNLAEVGVLFLATLFLTLKEPILLPVQLLWINLLTDGFPALALGIDPATPDIMNNPPRKKGESVINRQLTWLIGVIGSKKMIILFATFFIVLFYSGELQARTALFTGFILYEFVRIGSIRYQEKLTWLSNKWLLAALIGSVLLQLLIVYTPLNQFFHIIPLTWFSWIVLIVGIIIAYFSAIIATKIIVKHVKD